MNDTDAPGTAKPKRMNANRGSAFRFFSDIFGVIVFALLLAGCASLGGGSKSPIESAAPYKGHGAEAVDPAVVASFAPPPLPRELARNVQNILEVNAPGMGLLSPGGKSMYFTWAVSGVPQIWKLDGPLRFPVQMTSGADATTVIDVSPDGAFLVVSRDRAGEENPGLYLMSPDGGVLTEIQHKKGVRTSYVWTTTDSKKVFYLANDIKPDSYALYSYEVGSGKKELLFSEPGLWFVADLQGDHNFILGKSTGARTAEFYQWSLVSRELKPIIGQSEKEEYMVNFARTPGEYLVQTSKGEEFRRLFLLRGGELVPITPRVKMDVETFRVDHSLMRVYISWNDAGRTRLEVRDAATLKPVVVNGLPAGDQIYVGHISRHGRFVSLGVENALGPMVSYVYDWKSGVLSQWLRPSVPEVDSTRFVAATVESYPARDGTPIPMLVTRPKECKGRLCPVVVHFHGGPEGQSRPRFNKLAQIFVNAGYIFVEPNVRGSEGYGNPWRFADDGVKRLNVVTDIEDCARYIRKSWAVNGVAPKVGVMGGSYGGYSTLLAMTKFAGAYDAGVSIVGMSDLRSFLMNTAPYRRILRISEYGDPDKDIEALKALSPITYVDQLRDPLLIIQGVSDPRVPVGEALQMRERIVRRGIDAPLILFADEGHGSQKRDNRVLEIGHTLKFFDRYLR